MTAPLSPPAMAVIVCGAREAVGQAVIEGLKPEYDVILFCVGATALAAELPQLLTSPSTFQPQSSKLGSFPPSSSSSSSSSPSPASSSIPYNFPPRALIFGGLWGPEDIQSVQSAIRDAPHADQLAIFRNNLERQQGLAPGQPGYSEQIIRRTKAALAKLRDGDGDGTEGLDKVEGMEGVYWY